MRAAWLPGGRRPAGRRLPRAAPRGRRAPPPRGAQIATGRDLGRRERPRRPRRRARGPLAHAPGCAGRLAGVAGHSAVGPAAGPSAPGECLGGSHSVVSLVHRRKLEHKEIKSLARGRPAGKMRRLISNPCTPAQGSRALAPGFNKPQPGISTTATLRFLCTRRRATNTEMPLEPLLLGTVCIHSFIA